MEKGRETLKLQNPMVIFCDETVHPIIKAIRDEEVSDQTLTRYIIRSLTDYDLYRDNYPIIRKNREGVDLYVNDRNTSSYLLVQTFKFLAIQTAYQKNFFNTPFYTWIDFGGSHIMRNFNQGAIKALQNPNEKVSLCYIHYRSHSELQNRLLNRIQGGYCGIAGTSFSVQAEYVSRFYNGCMSIFNEMLSRGIGHGEEQILTFFYDRFPELCTLSYGDYYSILNNYHNPVEDISAIRHYFINEAMNKGRPDLAKQCAKALLNSVQRGLLQLDEQGIRELGNLVN